MKYIHRLLKPAAQYNRLEKFLTPFLFFAAFQGVSEGATSLVLNAAATGGGDYYIQAIPGIGASHIVQGGDAQIQNNYNDYYQWSFAYIEFDLSSVSEPVDQALLTLQINRASGSGGSTDTPATVDLYSLTSDYADLDGTADGDFMDYVAGGSGDLDYVGGDFPNYLEIQGDADQATAWYESQFGSETIAVPSVATLTFEGNDNLDYGTIDITDLVNAWISGEVENNGIGIILTFPDVYQISLSTSDNPPTGTSAPSLTLIQIPEPTPALLGALGGLAVLGIRRRRND